MARESPDWEDDIWNKHFASDWDTWMSDKEVDLTDTNATTKSITDFLETKAREDWRNQAMRWAWRNDKADFILDDSTSTEAIESADWLSEESLTEKIEEVTGDTPKPDLDKSTLAKLATRKLYGAQYFE